MRRWMLAGVVATLAACGLWLAYAADPDPVNTVPQSNASFMSDLQNYLREEDSDRHAEMFSGFVVQNGQHGTGAGLTGNPGSLIAYPGGARITETATITYSDASVCWTIANRATTGNLASFVRVAGTHYLIDCVTVLQPTLPADSVYLMKVTTATGAISAVTDLRLRVPYATRVEAVADLPADAFFGRLMWVDATKSYYVGTGGTTFVRVAAQASSAALTTGSVPFADSAGRLTQDNANLFWDDTNNRLGIGTATPTQPLDVIGNAKVGGTLSSTKACATGFTRVAPNYCRHSATGSFSFAWTNAAACTARTTGRALPADAKLVRLVIIWEALSNNAVGSRGNNLKFFPNAACTVNTENARSDYTMREEVAVIAGTNLGIASDHVDVTLGVTDTFHTTQTNVGGNGNAQVNAYSVEGYFD